MLPNQQVHSPHAQGIFPRLYSSSTPSFLHFLPPFALCKSLDQKKIKELRRLAALKRLGRFYLRNDGISHTSALDAAALRRTRRPHAGEVGIDFEGNVSLSSFRPQTHANTHTYTPSHSLAAIIQQRHVQVAQEREAEESQKPELK